MPGAAKLDDIYSESVISFDPSTNTASMHLYNSSLGGGNSGVFGLYSGASHYFFNIYRW